MEMFLLWFALSIAVGAYASSKGRSGFGLFLLSVFLSPIVGLLFAVALRDKVADRRHAELIEALRRPAPQAPPQLPAQSVAADPEPARPLLTTYAIKDDSSPINAAPANDLRTAVLIAVGTAVAVAVAAAVFATSDSSSRQSYVTTPDLGTRNYVTAAAERKVTDKYVELGYDVKNIELRITSPNVIEGTMLVNEPTGKPRYVSCRGTSTNGSSYQITCK